MAIIITFLNLATNIAIFICICYNASRLRDMRISIVNRRKPRRSHLRGFLFLFLNGSLDHRLVACYLSPSSHLQMRWLTTPATTAMIRDMRYSIANTPFLSPDLGRQQKHYIIRICFLLYFFLKKVWQCQIIFFRQF